jgi:hypothetical protein
MGLCHTFGNLIRQTIHFSSSACRVWAYNHPCRHGQYDAHRHLGWLEMCANSELSDFLEGSVALLSLLGTRPWSLLPHVVYTEGYLSKCYKRVTIHLQNAHSACLLLKSTPRVFSTFNQHQYPTIDCKHEASLSPDIACPCLRGSSRSLPERNLCSGRASTEGLPPSTIILHCKISTANCDGNSSIDAQTQTHNYH